MYDYDDKYFQTADLSLATFLYCYFPIDSISKEKDNRVLIAFKNSRELIKSMELYWNRSASVDPQIFFQNLKLLKSRIYEELRK